MSELLTTQQVAAFFQVSPTTIRRWRRMGFLPYVKGPGRGRSRAVRYRHEDLEQLVEELAWESVRYEQARLANVAGLSGRFEEEGSGSRSGQNPTGRKNDGK